LSGPESICRSYCVTCGVRTSIFRTRVPSSPAIKAESCDGVSRIMPSSIFGQRNVPCSSRCARIQSLAPSQRINLTRSARLVRKTKIAPEKDRRAELLHHCRELVQALAEVHQPRRNQHSSPARYRNHTDLNVPRTARSTRSSIRPRTVARPPPDRTISIVPACFVSTPDRAGTAACRVGGSARPAITIGTSSGNAPAPTRHSQLPGSLLVAACKEDCG
jgi:hypothetical protein